MRNARRSILTTLLRVFPLFLLGNPAIQSHASADPAKPFLFRAIEAGNIDRVKGMSREKDYLEQQYKNHNAVYWSVSNGSLELTRYFIEQGVPLADACTAPDCPRPGTGEAALLLAVSRQHRPLIELLLENGANPNGYVYSGESLYESIAEAAIRTRSEAVLTLLLQHGMNAYTGLELIDQTDLNLYADLDEKTRRSLPDRYYEFVSDSHAKTYRPNIHLLYAITRTDSLGEVKQLVEQGVDYNQSQNRRWSPLIVALHASNDAVIDYLLGLEDIQADYPVFSASPLVLASLQGRHDAVERLLQRGADIEAVRGGSDMWDEGFSPLIAALVSNEHAIVKTLLEHGAKLRCHLLPLAETEDMRTLLSRYTCR